MLVIDVASRSVVSVIPVDVHKFIDTSTDLGYIRPPLAVTADGAFVYVGNRDNGVTVIDTETNTVVAEIDLGRPIRDIAIMQGISR